MNNIKVLKIENRIHALTQRDPVINKNIINKLKRTLRNIKN
jgi:hypothetical protein